jgi:hypothetical protein
MTADRELAFKQIDAAIAAYDEERKKSEYDDLGDRPDAEVMRIIALLSAAIDRLVPQGSRYRQLADDSMVKYTVTHSANTKFLLGILKAIRTDYENGSLSSFPDLARAEIFADFLEMAHYLLEQDYKDPAAVLIGGVLEEHLRKLCTRSGITPETNSRPKKADAMNSELAKAEAYSKLDQKAVTSWLDLRNKAAHGQYASYTREQVALMLQAVRDFIQRTL